VTIFLDLSLGDCLDGCGDGVAVLVGDHLGRKDFARVRADEVHGHADVLRLRGHVAEREAHRVRAVGGDDVERIDAIAQGLAHLLSHARPG
jgi:hypothetical protein